MTAPSELFAPRAPGGGETFRPRGLLAEGFQRFGPARDGFEVFVSAEASDELDLQTSVAAPAEASGLVVGRAFADETGPYLIVVATAAARVDYADPGRVVVSGRELQRLKSELEGRFPTTDIVGWWHSHAHLSSFSTVDQAEQTTWQAENHVGILTFQTGAALKIYRGPAATPLARHTATHRRELLPVPKGPRTGEPRSGHRSRVGALLWSCVAGAVLAAASAVGIVLSRSQAPPETSTQRPPGLSWSCSAASLRLRCQGPVGPGVLSWHWSINGEAVGAAHPLLDVAAVPGSHSVELVVVSPAGSYATTLHHVVIQPEAELVVPE